MTLTIKAKAITPKPVWDALKWGKLRAIRGLQGSFDRLGLNVAKKSDYSSPLPIQSELKRTESLWNKPSVLTGVEYDLDAMKARVSSLLSRYGEEITGLQSYEQGAGEPFGPGFQRLDAMVLYGLLRDLKPKRYVEVGSGVSTYYASLAAVANRREGHPLEIHCIDPSPYPKLYSIPGIHITPTPVQEVDLAEFERLDANDVLFIDSSHVLKIGSDVAFLFLEVIPAMSSGVYVHVHDVSFPYNIPFPVEQWVFEKKWPRYWNEAMVVQTFLCFNHAFEIFLSCPLITHFDEAFVEEIVPADSIANGAGNRASSLWIRRLVEP